jgi:hypothetical protein
VRNWLAQETIMQRSFARFAIAFVVLLVAAMSVGAETRERQLANLALFQEFAGEPVDQIRKFNLDRWQALGPKHLAVWAHVNDAFLIEVTTPCIGLEYADVISITSSAGFVSRFDRVLVKEISGVEYRCPIKEIRPVDYKALRAERKARKEAAKKPR